MSSYQNIKNFFKDLEGFYNEFGFDFKIFEHSRGQKFLEDSKVSPMTFGIWSFLTSSGKERRSIYYDKNGIKAERNYRCQFDIYSNYFEIVAYEVIDKKEEVAEKLRLIFDSFITISQNKYNMNNFLVTRSWTSLPLERVNEIPYVRYSLDFSFNITEFLEKELKSIESINFDLKEA